MLAIWAVLTVGDDGFLCPSGMYPVNIEPFCLECPKGDIYMTLPVIAELTWLSPNRLCKQSPRSEVHPHNQTLGVSLPQWDAQR
jgi:hypothetical protein